jgi:4-amino-4-deoxy-L-arabinose transferase-like glycosyltransferase
MIQTSLIQQPVEIKKITRQRLFTVETAARWSLPLILVFQTVVSWALLQNTAFQDEALYLYAGRQIVQHWFGGPLSLDNYSYYFSGFPYVYPIIGGTLDMLGGLELARAFSTVCMLIVTICGYYVTKQLFNQKSAVFAALFFVCQAPVLFLSRLATYDPLCLCLIALSTALAVHASQSNRPWRALGIGPLLVLAFGAKYAALLFIPSILAILILCTLLKWGRKRALIIGAIGVLSTLVIGASAMLLVIHADPDMLHALNATTTNRVVIAEYSRTGLIVNIIQLVGISYVVGFASLFFVRKKALLITLLLLGSALLVPAYHIYKAELTSLDKHLGFSMFFVMPVAGYALARLSGFRRGILPSGRYLLSGLAICLFLFLVVAPNAQSMYLSWPPTNVLTNVLKTQVRAGNGRYLAEQFEVSRYNLRNETSNWQWTGLDFFQYTDKQGHYYLGNVAYVKAIDDGYFDVIQLNYGYNVSTAILIARTIASSHKYDLIDKVPYRDTYGSGYFWIWRKH